MKSKPLKGKRILVTRAKPQAQQFANKVRALGGIPVVIPLLTIRPPNNVDPLIDSLSRIQQFDWLVLTSQNGVRAFFSIYRELGINPKKILELKIAVVGTKTLEAVVAHGYDGHLIPEGDFTAEALVEALLQKLRRGERVLMARGNLARDILPDCLRQNGMYVEDVVAYETIINKNAQSDLVYEVIDRTVDGIAFTSSSTVTHFIELLNHYHWRAAIADTCLAAIGPITEKTMLANQLIPDVVASVNTTDGLLEDMTAYFIRRNKDE